MAKRKQAQAESAPTAEPTQSASQSETNTAEPALGNIPPNTPAADPAAAPTRDNPAFDVSRRLMAEGRWFGNLEHVRDQMLLDAKRGGMSKVTAKDWVYRELDRLYPPLGQPQPDTETPAPPRVATSQVQGLGDIPWADLPANASLASEIQWVQSNRLYIVEETSTGAVKVHLDRAHEPPPSRAALGWLETSIRSYAKYVDVAAKATSGQQDEAEHVRHERLAIEEMRELLREMKPVCPACGASLM